MSKRDLGASVRQRLPNQAREQGRPFQDGTLLLRAVHATFKRRSTEIEALPVGLTSEFSSAPGKSAQWKAFLRRSRFEAEHTDVDEVIVAVRNFAGATAICSGRRKQICVLMES